MASGQQDSTLFLVLCDGNVEMTHPVFVFVCDGSMDVDSGQRDSTSWKHHICFGGSHFVLV